MLNVRRSPCLIRRHNNLQMPPTLSIITPSFNQAPFLEDTRRAVEHSPGYTGD